MVKILAAIASFIVDFYVSAAVVVVVTGAVVTRLLVGEHGTLHVQVWIPTALAVVGGLLSSWLVLKLIDHIKKR